MKRLAIISGAIVAILVLALGGLFAFAYYRGVGSSAEPVEGAAAYIAPTPTARALPGLPLAGGSTAGTPRQSVSASTPTPAPVSFNLVIEVSRPAESSVFLGVSVKVFLIAELTNRGDFEAHNVNVTARARVGEDYVAINGKQALVVPIGTVGPRRTTSREISFDMDMSLSQGQTAQNQGIYFEVVVTSAEANSYIPLMLCNQTKCAPA